MSATALSRTARGHCRRGAAALIILAVFAITITLAGVWAKRVVTQRRSQRLAEDHVQADWLAEAGVRRAAAQLTVDADYKGEEWRIPAGVLGRPGSATVVIRVEAGSSAGQLQLMAQARYPNEQPRVQSTKSVHFTPPNPESGP